MNTATNVEIHLDDGSFFAPRQFLEAIGEEYDARGHLTVAEAASLCEKWSRPSNP